MDRERFDALARLLATTGSRRGAASALVSVALLGRSPATLAGRRHTRGEGEARGRGDASHQDRARAGRGNASPADAADDDGGSGAGGGGSRQRGPANGQGRRRGLGSGRDRQELADARAVPASCFNDDPCAPGPRADLRKCDFTDTSVLKDINCAGCNLQGASLVRANAAGADFTRANLGRVCLVDADLTGATFSNTNRRGAIYCRTIMPDGSINNSGCGNRSTCCPVCIPIGNVCGAGVTGSCCGGAACQNGRCACPANKPVDCNGVCQQCCGDGNCSGSTPKCCGGVCRQCCQSRECPARVCRTADCTGEGSCDYTVVPDNRSGPRCSSPLVCCNGGCCDAGQVCDTRDEVSVCCTPESRAATCEPPGRLSRCGKTPNNCGELVDCGPCDEVVCNTGACTNRLHICQYTPVNDLTRCTTEAIAAGICCDGRCVEGTCCGNANCNRNANRCANNTCRCGSGPECNPFETCCGASPAGTCADTTRDVNNCGRCGNRCSRYNICRGDPPRCCLYPGSLCSYLGGLNRRCCSQVCRPVLGIPLGFGTCD